MKNIRLLNWTLIVLFFIACTEKDTHKTVTIDSSWPVLKTYDQDHIQRIAMPVGGIGTGTISLKGWGSLEDWEIMNRPAKGYNPSFEQKRAPFFAINIQDKDTAYTRLLEGRISPSLFEGSMGSSTANHGLPRFAHAGFETTYPFGNVQLTDPNLPVAVKINAFNPLIPGNIDDSSIPMMILTYTVKNTSNTPLAVSLSGNIKNFIGHDGKSGKEDKNKNQYIEEGSVKGIYFTSEGVDKDSEQWGTMALASLNEGEITYRTSWNKYHWGSSTLDFWDDFSDDGLLENRPDIDENAPMASLAVKSQIAPGEEKDFRFLIAWHFPNRKPWHEWHEQSEVTIGNYYTTQYRDAWEVIQKTVPKINKLEEKTVDFVHSFMSSDLPKVIKEAALFNLANLRTQLVFRNKKGYMLGWEGNFENEGACFGSCTHVWNYEQTTAFLFGGLAKTMRDVEFGHATDKNGLMSFRVFLPLEENAQKFGKAAADGQMGSIMKFYREWQLSGDDAFLKKHWPAVKKALQFSWIEGGWDANKDGVMEGAQHNTMDVEYFGPNPQMGFWYLGALRACEEMANYLGEKDFADDCKKLYENGAEWVDANLFNGEYYEHKIIPPLKKENIAPSLLLDMGSENLSNPDYQLGKGVLVDQLIGQLMAHFVGLGYLGKEENIKKTHESIMKYNHREQLNDHVNFMRSYALADESALLMAAYPKERPKTPFPYFTEVMTGFEYTAAIGMLYEGQIENGLKCIQNIRDRYDGRKRSPFNEAEYGNHYARAMIAWGGVLAMTGFHYSAVDQSMTLNPKNGTFFWSNGYQYGTVQISGNDTNKMVKLSCKNDTLTLKNFNLKGFGNISFEKGKNFPENKPVSISVDSN